MPSRVATSGTTARFELPALDLNFGNITDGTNIPPPPKSPIRTAHTPPPTPPLVLDRDSNGVLTSAPLNGNLAGTKRPADDAPLSPAASSRQGSLRRFLSRTMLNSAYAEGQSQPLPVGDSSVSPTDERPQSRGGMSFMGGERASKRASGWFRKFRSGSSSGSRRPSIIGYENTTSFLTSQKSSGPPPPMLDIPELVDLEKDGGSLGGGDLFKNIR